jgi:hypothetical protein
MRSDVASQRRVRSRALWLLLGATLVVAAVLVWWWSRGGEAGALRALPDRERSALHQRTMENLRTICARDSTAALRRFCREQAEIVLKLPECDDACRELAKRFLPAPTR